MQISELTRTLAPACGQAPESMRVRMQQLYGVPELAALGMTGRRGTGVKANATTAGMLVLTALVAGETATIGGRVSRLWHAPYADVLNAKTDPVTGAGTLGGALEKLLTDPELAAVLDFIDVGRTTELVGVAWTDRPAEPSRFHPRGGRGYRAIVAAYIDKPNIENIARLPGEAVRLAGRLINERDIKPGQA